MTVFYNVLNLLSFVFFDVYELIRLKCTWILLKISLNCRAADYIIFWIAYNLSFPVIYKCYCKLH